MTQSPPSNVIDFRKHLMDRAQRELLQSPISFHPVIDLDDAGSIQTEATAELEDHLLEDLESAFELEPELQELARTLASSFLRHTQQGEPLFEKDTVTSFIQLHWLFKQIVQEAETFVLNAKADILALPLHLLLVEFATYRVVSTSKAYWEQARQYSYQCETVEQLRQQLKVAQKELFHVLSHPKA